MVKEEIIQVKILEKEVTPFLVAKGYKERAPLYYEADLFPEVHAAISIGIRKREGVYNFQIIYTITYNQIEKYWVNYKADLNEPDQPRQPTLAFVISEIDPQLETGYDSMYGGSWYKVPTDKDVQEFATIFKNQYTNVIEPFIKQAADVRWMNNKINYNPIDLKQVSPFHKQNLIFKKLIIAKLAGDTKYEDIYMQLREFLNRILVATNNELTQKGLMVLNKIHEDLKNIEPLQNPVLILV